jgi:hypothetical protein
MSLEDTFSAQQKFGLLPLRVAKAAVIVSALVVSGCMPEQTQTLAACEVESMARHFGRAPVASIEQINSCMEAHGYVRRLAAGCQPETVSVSPVCYQPDSWIGRIGMQLELFAKSLTENHAN